MGATSLRPLSRIVFFVALTNWGQVWKQWKLKGCQFLVFLRVFGCISHFSLCVCLSCKVQSHTIIQPKDKVVPFLKKLLYLVAAKLSLEFVPFCKTQGNSRDHSLNVFLFVFVFFLAFRL